ncbi:MAG: phytanoyl-CoA dioxygenase family protein [Acidocella sp.]|nr:phytanoyl-CoA dioxygenase family protein [Acidocella sp.]
MSNHLTTVQIAQFNQEGWLAPFRAIPEAEAARAVDWVDEYERIHQVNVNRHLKIKAHLAAPWILALAQSDNILDAVEGLIGPDIMLFGASIFAKAGQDQSFVSWHQDSAYFGLEPHEEITAWVALTASNEANGALQVLPRSHTGPDLPHIETYAANNMLARGQSLTIEDESHAVTMNLAPGEFSLHHERTAHGSKQNNTATRRIGFAFFYIPPHAQCPAGRRTALLVRGQDKYGHWDRDPLPRYDFDPPAYAAMLQAWGAYRDGEVKQAAHATTI